MQAKRHLVAIMQGPAETTSGILRTGLVSLSKEFILVIKEVQQTLFDQVGRSLKI